MLKTVAVVESDKTSRHAICGKIGMEISARVLEFESSFDLIRHFHHNKLIPEMVFTNICIDRIDGITLTDYLSDHFPEVRTVAVSTNGQSEILLEFLSAGGKAFILACNLHLLSEAIREVSGDRLFVDTSLDAGPACNERFIISQSNKKMLKTRYCITKREAMFMTLNATGLEYHEIAGLMFITTKTVDNIFTSISKKVGLKNRHNLTLFTLRNCLTRIAKIQYAQAV